MLRTFPRDRDFALSRRRLVQLGVAGLTLPQLFARRAVRGGESTVGLPGFGRAKSCIVLFAWGGMSHLDTWDLKPDGPAEVRGEFQPIATSVPGIRLCEHLPRLARAMDRLCLVRSMTHHMPVHGPACSEIYSGRPYFGAPTTDQRVTC